MIYFHFRLLRVERKYMLSDVSIVSSLQCDKLFVDELASVLYCIYFVTPLSDNYIILENYEFMFGALLLFWYYRLWHLTYHCRFFTYYRPLCDLQSH